MADEQAAPQPGPPAGMQRPGVPGAGNILDPAVRGEIRQQLHPAVHDAMQKARGQQPAAEKEPAGEKQDAPVGPPAAGYRSGPYPHGDVDLRSLVPNVPAEPIRPQRGRAARRFYFLGQAGAPAAVPAVQQPPGPKPG